MIEIANNCLILTANGGTMVVRDCALDSGTLTTDTELVRMSHCGGFYFDDQYVSGCIQSCFEDACNGITTKYLTHSIHILFTHILVIVVNGWMIIS